MVYIFYLLVFTMMLELSQTAHAFCILLINCLQRNVLSRFNWMPFRPLTPLPFAFLILYAIQGISPLMINRFFKPFFQGIFLSPLDLQSSRMFEFVFKVAVTSDTMWLTLEYLPANTHIIKIDSCRSDYFLFLSLAFSLRLKICCPVWICLV